MTIEDPEEAIIHTEAINVFQGTVKTVNWLSQSSSVIPLMIASCKQDRLSPEHVVLSQGPHKAITRPIFVNDADSIYSAL